MILRPRLEDFKVIGFYLGRVIIAIGILNLLPLLVALGAGEINVVLDFAISAATHLIYGYALVFLCRTKKEIGWMHGMVVAALSWLFASALGALPLYLSGHWASYLDAMFDATSGYATTGLTLVRDLDHLAMGHNFWRHFMMFLGGQGIVVAALSFLVRGSVGTFTMYVGEARDERILPNIIHTARFIWLVSIVYLILGTLALGIAAIWEGMPTAKAFFHGVCIFMAAFDTGGFAPHSQNILYYHSFLLETITVIIMFLGAINFKLHYALWNGDRKEIWKNIETITFFAAIIFTFALVASGLARNGVYPQIMVMFRKGFYQLISGHTGTGYMTIYAKQFMAEWGPLALLALIVAMALGGCACSTTGGIKMLRVGLVWKALRQDVKQILSPEASIIVEKFHHIKERILEDKQARSATMIMLCYLLFYGAGAIIGVVCGYPLREALFESVSALANVGLSCGITGPSMPGLLKVTYIIQMIAGRLEFISVFALIGFVVAAVKGR
ncbi:MAG: TrkH family potassium uptake protein [Candidatus Omnitrophota bacterium]